jgi:hypothetical protein
MAIVWGRFMADSTLFSQDKMEYKKLWKEG